MRLCLPLALLLLAACSGPPPRPAVAQPEGGTGAPSVTVGGGVRGLYGITR